MPEERLRLVRRKKESILGGFSLMRDLGLLGDVLWCCVNAGLRQCLQLSLEFASIT